MEAVRLDVSPDTAGSERCQACRPGVVKYTSASGQAHCHLEALSGVMALLATLSQILLAVLLANMLGSRIPIQDMCFKAGQGVVVTTATIHMVRPRAHVTVHLEGTGRPWLDTKPTSSVALKAVVLDPCSLLLLDQEGNTLPEGSSTSCWLVEIASGPGHPIQWIPVLPIVGLGRGLLRVLRSDERS